MPTIYIPNQLRTHTNGVASITVVAETVRQAVEALEDRFPGLKERLVEEGNISRGMAVSINGSLTPRGLRARLDPDSEVHFVPAIGGG